LARRKTDKPTQFLCDRVLEKGIKIGDDIYRYTFYVRVVTIEGKDALLYHFSPDGLYRFLHPPTPPTKPGDPPISGTLRGIPYPPRLKNFPLDDNCMVLRMWWPGDFKGRSLTFKAEGGRIPQPGFAPAKPGDGFKTVPMDKDLFLQIQTDYMKDYPGERLRRIVRGCSYENRCKDHKPPVSEAHQKRYAKNLNEARDIEGFSMSGDDFDYDNDVVHYGLMLYAEMMATYKNRIDDVRFLMALAKTLLDEGRDITSENYERIVASVKAKLAIR
jgi:hypothetical protein